MNRLGEFVKGAAVDAVGRVGARGPIRAENVGELAVTSLAYGNSVDLAFSEIGSDLTQLSLFRDGSPIEQSIDLLIELANAASDALLLEEIRFSNERVVRDFLDILDLLIAERVSVGLAARQGRAYLAPPKAGWLLVTLDRKSPPITEVQTVVGTLYEADAKNYGFRIEPDREGAAVIHGHYIPADGETIRAAWNRKVRAEIEVTYEQLLRPTGEPRPTFRLVSVEVIESPDQAN